MFPASPPLAYFPVFRCFLLFYWKKPLFILAHSLSFLNRKGKPQPLQKMESCCMVYYMPYLAFLVLGSFTGGP